MNWREKRAETIAAAGRKETAKRQTDSVTSIHLEMKKIDAEILANNGVYPLNEGKLNIQELLRRVEKSPAYLEKKTPRIIALKTAVTSWLTDTDQKILKGAANIRRSVTERADKANDEVDEIRQAWAEAELEHAQTFADLVAANATIAALKKQNEDLEAKLTDAKVVRFPGKSK
jgi:polyhydroxyalkanoate synthesis regulator phasin